MEQRCAIQHRSPLAELALEKCGTAQKSSGSEPRRFGRRHEPTSKTNNQRLEEVQERVGSIMSMRVMLSEINGAGGQVEIVVFCKVPD